MQYDKVSFSAVEEDEEYARNGWKFCKVWRFPVDLGTDDWLLWVESDGNVVFLENVLRTCSQPLPSQDIVNVHVQKDMENGHWRLVTGRWISTHRSKNVDEKAPEKVREHGKDWNFHDDSH